MRLKESKNREIILISLTQTLPSKGEPKSITRQYKCDRLLAYYMFLRTCSRSTAPLPVVLGRCSKSSFTHCKLRFLRSVRTQLTAVRNDLEQVLRVLSPQELTYKAIKTEKLILNKALYWLILLLA